MPFLSPASPGWTLAKVAFALVIFSVAGACALRLARREFARAPTRQVAYAVVLTAIAVALGQFTVPVGGARPAPGQHFVNLLAAVTLGPWWATLIAFGAAVLRNLTGTGTALAFPGGMIGAFLAGFAWRTTAGLRAADSDAVPSTVELSFGDRIGLSAASMAEVLGSGVLGALVSGWFVAPAIMGLATPATTYVSIFLVSSLTGVILGLAAAVALRRAGFLRFDPGW